MLFLPLSSSFPCPYLLVSLLPLSLALCDIAPFYVSIVYLSLCSLFTHLNLSAPQRCNAERSDAQRNFSYRNSYPFLQRHRCDALPCFSASPVIMFYIAHIAFPPLLPFSFRHNGLLYKTTRNLPKITTQRCRHWQAGWPSQTQTQTQRCSALRPQLTSKLVAQIHGGESLILILGPKGPSGQSMSGSVGVFFLLSASLYLSCVSSLGLADWGCKPVGSDGCIPEGMPCIPSGSHGFRVCLA